MTRLLFLLCLTLIISSCQRRPVPPTVYNAANALAVAEVNNIVITDQDLNERISRITKKFPRDYSGFPQKKELLQEMMNIELLYQEALRHKLDQTFDFKSRLADLYVQEIAEGARSRVTEKTVEDYYNKNKNTIDQISARHIILRNENGNRAENKKKLEQWRSELVAKPNEFSEYAKKYSQDSSAQNGGELGYFIYSSMVAPFASAAFNLKNIGDISPVVETEFGFHIIQLSGDRRSLDYHRDAIRREILKKTQTERLKSEIERLKKDKKFVIYEKNLAKVSPLPEEITNPTIDGLKEAP